MGKFSVKPFGLKEKSVAIGLIWHRKTSVGFNGFRRMVFQNWCQFLMCDFMNGEKSVEAFDKQAYLLSIKNRESFIDFAVFVITFRGMLTHPIKIVPTTIV